MYINNKDRLHTCKYIVLVVVDMHVFDILSCARFLGDTNFSIYIKYIKPLIKTVSQNCGVRHPLSSHSSPDFTFFMLVRWNTSTSNKKTFCVGLLSVWLNSESFRQSGSKLPEGHSHTDTRAQGVSLMAWQQSWCWVFFLVHRRGECRDSFDYQSGL